MKVLVGLFGGEDCYFSNNLGFVGMCVLYKGRGLGLSDFLVLLLRIPYASGHPRGLFLFLQSVTQPRFLERNPALRLWEKQKKLQALPSGIL